MQTWFECKVKYLKVTNSGSEQMVTESFLVDAVSYTDAETRIISEMQKMVKGGDFGVVSISKSRIAEVFAAQDGEFWWKATIAMITIDEEAGREKRIKVAYLLMADDAQEALTRLEINLDYVLVPFQLQSLAISPIVDVIPYDLDAAAAEMQKAE